MTIIQSSKPLAQRHAHDFYETPLPFCRSVVAHIVQPLPARARVLDPGAGTGNWGLALKERYPDAHLIGIDERLIPAPPQYDTWIVGDYLTDWPALREPFDLILGNPPFGLAQGFITQSLRYLAPRGQLVFLLRLAYLATRVRYNTLYRHHPPSEVWTSVSRLSFKNNGRTDDTEYAVFGWRPGVPPAPAGAATTVHRWLDWKGEHSCGYLL